jgi:hypothetical protein
MADTVRPLIFADEGSDADRVLVDLCHRERSFAHGRRDALDRVAVDVARGEHARRTGLQQHRLAGEIPALVEQAVTASTASVWLSCNRIHSRCDEPDTATTSVYRRVSMFGVASMSSTR